MENAQARKKGDLSKITIPLDDMLVSSCLATSLSRVRAFWALDVLLSWLEPIDMRTGISGLTLVIRAVSDTDTLLTLSTAGEKGKELKTQKYSRQVAPATDIRVSAWANTRGWTFHTLRFAPDKPGPEKKSIDSPKAED